MYVKVARLKILLAKTHESMLSFMIYEVRGMISEDVFYLTEHFNKGSFIINNNFAK